jgi:hypothetical protein
MSKSDQGGVMSRLKTMLAALVLTAAGGAVFVAAQSTVRPGDPTQARVWIENRSANEAVPVTIERFGSTPSVHVSSVDASVVLSARAVRQRWEYRVGSLDASALEAAGNDGWEAVGTVPASGGASVLLKRPR